MGTLNTSFNEDGEGLAKKCKKLLEMAKLLLEKPQKCYEKQVNAGRREMGYEVGQKMLFNVKNFTLSKSFLPKVMSTSIAPFPIMERVFKDMYKLYLFPEIKGHPTFNVSLLKPFKKYTLCLDCKQVIRLPPNFVGDHLEYEVEGILKCRNRKQKKLLDEVARIP